MKESKFIWQDGELIPWNEAKIHVLSHSLHYGNAVFEGTRAYHTKRGLAIFRLEDHVNRLLDSAKIVLIDCRYTKDELVQAHLDLLRANSGDYSGNVYIRPIIYLGYGSMGVYHVDAPVHVSIASWEWGAYLGETAIEKGIRVKISSFVRNSVKSSMGKAKASANYLNSQMAKHEAIACGFDEALLLDDNGFIAEGSGECIFIVKNSKLITPPYDNSLVSITQLTVMYIASELGIPLEQRRITRDEIYCADEAFFTGTAAEITPICEVDFRKIGIGERGEVTRRLQDEFFMIVTGKKDTDFLTYI